MGRDPAVLTCPFCESAEVELVAPWAGQMITAQWRCGACASYFEAIREAYDGDAAPANDWR